MASVRIELKTLLIAVLSILCIEILTLTAAARLTANGLLVTGIARLLEILAMVLILDQAHGRLAVVGLRKATAVDGFLRGLFWSAGFGVLAICAGFIMVISGINPLHLIGTASPSPLSRIFLLFLIGGVIGPVAEEFFFRGILYGYFRRWGVLPALLLSTASFVLMHPISPFVLTQTIGGIVFALAYEREKNLLVPITIHVLGNWAIFGLTLSV